MHTQVPRVGADIGPRRAIQRIVLVVLRNHTSTAAFTSFTSGEDAYHRLHFRGSFRHLGSARRHASRCAKDGEALMKMIHVRQHQAVGASYVSIIGAVRAAPQRAFAGVLPRLVRVPAGMAAMMTGIEGSKWVLAERRRSELC
eukprot:scaffold191203_cov40-Tisochrysis_lutea.AAC.1